MVKAVPCITGSTLDVTGRKTDSNVNSSINVVPKKSTLPANVTDSNVTSSLDDIVPPNMELNFDVDAQYRILQSFNFPYSGVGKNRRRFQLSWLNKYAKSQMHLDAEMYKHERKKRDETNTSVSILVNSTVLLKRRYYFTTIVKSILFLVEHHLALRGS